MVASSFQMAKNSMYQIEGTLASHYIALNSIKTDCISNESFISFLFMLREHIDIGDAHVRDLLTMAIGELRARIHELQERVAQVTKHMGKIKVHYDASLNEIESSYDNRLEQCVGELHSAFTAHIEAIVQGYDTKIRPLENSIGSVVRVEEKYTKKQAEIETRLDFTMNSRCESLVRRLLDSRKGEVMSSGALD